MVTDYIEYKRMLDSYTGARSMLETESDAEMRSMAQDEISELEPALDKAAEALQLELLPKDPNDEKNTIIEVRAGVGGDEAGIFAGDLFRMYVRYAEAQKWKVEVLSLSEASAGGYKEAIALIEGERVYSQLKYESGVHRVQRVPKTETQGRIHTSTASVIVLPEAEEVEIDINPNELRIDVFRSGGSGGQSVNTTDSAVRITHIPTNEVVICQDEKSQLKNKNKAMKVLRSRLLEKAQAEQNKTISDARKSQVGGGFRNERIRTYNFPQGRVTDHRIGLTSHNIDEVMNGKITPFIAALNNHAQLVALKGEDAVKPISSGPDD
jgi:peptide chain release factor 1